MIFALSINKMAKETTAMARAKVEMRDTATRPKATFPEDVAEEATADIEVVAIVEDEAAEDIKAETRVGTTRPLVTTTPRVE